MPWPLLSLFLAVIGFSSIFALICGLDIKICIFNAGLDDQAAQKVVQPFVRVDFSFNDGVKLLTCFLLQVD